MSKGRIISTNIRFNLEKEADRTAWDHLQRRDKREHRSYSRAVIAAVNNYFERRGQLDTDPYLEAREKEDAFLLRVLETIRAGLGQSVRSQPTTVEEVPLEDQQEADDMALDFVDGF